jgi:SAM-dependent methyltransferase
LTYPSDAFDLVLTSETLEHVPDPALALAEIRRILKPGGRHIFTLPVLPGIARSFPRIKIMPDGSRQYLEPPIHHPGGDSGYPVFTEWGADLPEILNHAGFCVDSRFGPPRDADLAQVWITQKKG